MSVWELNEDQLKILKGNYLDQHLMEVEGRNASYGELADADEIVSDEEIYNAYGCVDFSEDDFLC